MKVTRLFLLIFLFLSSYSFSQLTTVENITSRPYSYEGVTVTVKGLVTIYKVGSGNTQYYLLRGDYGPSIKVNTAEGSPEINEIYTVEGIVYVDKNTHVPFISERYREKVEPNPIIIEPTQTLWELILEFIETNILIIILIIVLIALVSTYFILRSKKSSENISANNPPSNLSSASDYPVHSLKLSPNDMQQQSNDDFKTIKITASSPKTLKFIPGKLTIVSGEDTGKSFKIAGYPTSEGSIVSIGREEVKGDRSYSHIQLMQKTISRKQAEIIQKDGKVYVRNLSDTNYTQIDGVELKINEKAELKVGSVLRLGELEVKYEV